MYITEGHGCIDQLLQYGVHAGRWYIFYCIYMEVIKIKNLVLFEFWYHVVKTINL